MKTWSFEELELQNLIKKYAISVGDFKLSGGGESKLYINMRKISLNGYAQSLIGGLIYRRIHENLNDPITCVGCKASAGNAIAAALVHRWSMLKTYINGFYITADKKKHGEDLLIQGTCEADDHVIIVDDVATSGKSLMDVAERVWSVGARVTGACVIVDREQGAKQLLSDAGIPLLSVFVLNDLIQ